MPSVRIKYLVCVMSIINMVGQYEQEINLIFEYPFTA